MESENAERHNSDMGNEEASLSTVAVLTPPLSLDGVNMNCGEGQKQHNILSRVLNLFKSVRPGADLTRFQLPPQFNMPKSQLQAYGESVYCSSEDLLSKCVEGGNEVERFKAVVAWSISTTRPTIFAKVPYNPILGETHHVSSGNLNVLLEQVSHHPPITALHATNASQEIEMTWWQHPAPRFYGRSVEATVHGQRILKLPAFGERYEMNCPKLSIRFFPSPSTEWVGIVTVQCKESGLEATLCYKGKSLFGLKGSSTRITGKIFKTNFPAQHLYELDGNWDQTVMVMDIKSGKTSMLYDAKATITKLKTPIVQNPRGLAPTESSLVWSVVNECILRKDWSGAREAKKMVEEKQRNLARERENEGRSWSPKYFSRREDGGWECLHHGQPLPPAPIVIPSLVEFN
eukprot:Gb_23064 [translate_table: standard]